MNDEIIKAIGKQVIDFLIEQGYINEISIRNAEIRRKYSEMRQSGLSARKAREILLKEPYVYYNGEAQYLTERNLIKILYGNAKNK